MFGRKVKDSIAVAKHMKITQERTLKVDRKRAIYTLLFQALFLVAVLVIQCLSFSFYNTIASSVVISLVMPKIVFISFNHVQRLLLSFFLPFVALMLFSMLTKLGLDPLKLRTNFLFKI